MRSRFVGGLIDKFLGFPIRRQIIICVAVGFCICCCLVVLPAVAIRLYSQLVLLIQLKQARPELCSAQRLNESASACENFYEFACEEFDATNMRLREDPTINSLQIVDLPCQFKHLSEPSF